MITVAFDGTPRAAFETQREAADYIEYIFRLSKGEQLGYILAQPIDPTGDPLDDWDEPLGPVNTEVQNALLWHQHYCETCDCSPCACITAQMRALDNAAADETICDICDCDPCACCEEPAMAGEVTGYDNGPTFW